MHGKIIDRSWEGILPVLSEYVAIPAKSPIFDPAWERNGHLDDAATLIADWAAPRLATIDGARMEIVRLPGRTPVILIEIPGSSDAGGLLMYGHFDKQPEMNGWADGLDPWKPVLRGDRLYGRGAADDGYAVFAAVTAIELLAETGSPIPRTIILIESCEESGSYDLPHYIEHLSDRIGAVELLVCLDSGCGNYDQLWIANSLRGRVAGTLTVRMLVEGVHSGIASGIVASPFRIMRQLLSRIEVETTGDVLLDGAHVAIPPDRKQQAAATAAVLGDAVYAAFPFVSGALPIADNVATLLLNRAWRPQLTVTGIEGLPDLAGAGTTLQPGSAAKLSLRLPPGVDAAAVGKQLRQRLESAPPYGAQVTFVVDATSDGWSAPTMAPWLTDAVDRASLATFGRPPAFAGEGGGIPFMNMFGNRFPAAQFLITGVLGPQSNAHGPNEFLDIPTAKKVTLAVAHVAESYAREIARSEQNRQMDDAPKDSA